MGRKYSDLSGVRFGSLTALRKVGLFHGNATWECRCDCGNTVVTMAASLKAGHTKSCGCLRKFLAAQQATIHGAAFPPSGEYRTWRNIKQRCLLQSNSSFRFYGARGITICERWKNSFQNFLNDMGPKPSPKHSIDRIDNNGSYEKSNCRWATAKEQSRNRQKNRWITANGKTQIPSDWAAEIGLTVATIDSRLRRGWDGARAVTTPAWKGKAP